MMSRLEGIADPVRLSVARYLAARPNASAPQVADGVAIHLNTARTHLAALEKAGLAERITETTGRPGRPVVRYRLRDGWAPQGDELLSLSALLASAVLRLDANPEEVRDVAREWGRRWAAESGSRPVEAQLAAALGRLGFQAQVTSGRLVLSACPCPLVAPDQPAVVCALADAVIDGVLEGSRLAAADRRHNPRSRRCSTALAPA